MKAFVAETFCTLSVCTAVPCSMLNICSESLHLFNSHTYVECGSSLMLHPHKVTPHIVECSRSDNLILQEITEQRCPSLHPLQLGSCLAHCFDCICCRDWESNIQRGTRLAYNSPMKICHAQCLLLLRMDLITNNCGIHHTVAVHSGGCPPSLLVPVCILLDVGWGHHAVSAGGTGVWNCSWEVVLSPDTGMGWVDEY